MNGQMDLDGTFCDDQLYSRLYHFIRFIADAHSIVREHTTSRSNTQFVTSSGATYYIQSFSLTECIVIVGVQKYRVVCLSLCLCVCVSVCVSVCLSVCSRQYG